MSKTEKKICDWIIGKVNVFFWLAVTGIAFLVRAKARQFLSQDAEFYLIPWFRAIRESGGMKGLAIQAGDYNLLYQTIIAILTYFPNSYDDMHILYLYKIISCIFDFVLAFATAELVCDMKGEKRFGTWYNTVYAVILFLPTVIANSAFWAQCDAIYTAFSILCLLYLYREKYVWAFVFLGIAFAFKLQAIFLLPFIVTYYFYKRKFSVLMFALSTAIFWASGIPAFFAGRSVLEPFRIYLMQSDLYKDMYLEVCNFWQLFAQDYAWFKNLAVSTTLILCGLGLYRVLSGRKKLDKPEELLGMAAWFVWTCVFFLPAMHERYTYMQDILVVALAFLDRKYAKYAVVCVVMSTIGYSKFLCGMRGVIPADSLIVFFAWAHFTYTILKEDDGSEKRVFEITS